MFLAPKAQFDLAMAWSELAMSTFTATTMIANSGAKVLAASAAAERATRPASQGSPSFYNPWAIPTAPSGIVDPMGLVLAATQATTAFWAALLEPPKPAPKPLPLWWTAFTDPLLPTAKPASPVSQTYLLH